VNYLGSAAFRRQRHGGTHLKPDGRDGEGLVALDPAAMEPHQAGDLVFGKLGTREWGSHPWWR
jgi:hypothetical protein